MTNELFLGLCGMVLSVVTFFAGVWWADRRHAKEEREARILRVVDKYMKFRRDNFTSGLDGLQRSGIAALTSNQEVQEVIRLVMAHAEPNPLGSDHARFKGVDLFTLFKFSAAHGHNFLNDRIEDLIIKSGAKREERQPHIR